MENKMEITNKVVLLSVVTDSDDKKAKEISLDELERLAETAGAEVFCRMILSHSRMVFAESNVQAPMERVFNAPMASGGVRKFRYIQQRRNIIVRFFRSVFILNHS